MVIGSIKTGDIVLVGKKGWEFWALVDYNRGSCLAISPLHKSVTYREAKAREVVKHYKLMGKRRASLDA